MLMSRIAALLLLVFAVAPLAAQPVPDPKAGEQQKTEEAKDASEPETKPLTGDVTAIFVQRALTLAGDPIDDAVIVVKDGKIERIGKASEVTVPAFATRVEAKDRVVMPGMIHVASLAYQAANAFSVAGQANSANRDLRESLSPTRAAAKALAKAGFTTACSIPTGGGFSGQGTLVKPVSVKDGDDAEQLLVADILTESNVVLSMGFAAASASKKQFTENLEKSKKYIEELEAWKKAGGKDEPAAKPDAPKKDGDATPATGAADKKPEPKKDDKQPEPKKDEPKPADKKDDGKKPDEKKDEAKKPEEKKGPAKPKEDPRLAPLVALLQKEFPGILAVSGVSSLLHLEKILADNVEFRPALMMVSGQGRFSRGGGGGSDVWRAVEQIKKLGCTVILTPSLTTRPDTFIIKVPQRELLDAGVPVVLIPSAESAAGYGSFLFDLRELVRYGIPRDQVLRAVTMAPAEVLGIQDRVGTLEVGKAADLLFLSADPLSPVAEVMGVMVGGKTVYEKSEDES